MGLAHHARGLVLLAVVDAPAVKLALRQVLLRPHAEEVVHPVPLWGRGGNVMQASDATQHNMQKIKARVDYLTSMTI